VKNPHFDLALRKLQNPSFSKNMIPFHKEGPKMFAMFLCHSSDQNFDKNLSQIKIKKMIVMSEFNILEQVGPRKFSNQRTQSFNTSLFLLKSTKNCFYFSRTIKRKES